MGYDVITFTINICKRSKYFIYTKHRTIILNQKRLV